MSAQASPRVPAFNYFGYVPKSGIAGSYSSSMFNLLRNCQTVFHSSYTILRSHQQCTSVPVSPYPCQHLLLSFFFFIIALLVGVKWYLTVVLICISLRTNDIEHISMCLLATCISSLKKYLFKSFAHF